MDKFKNCPTGNDNCKIVNLINFKNFPYFTSPVNYTNKKKILKNFSKNNIVCPLNVITCQKCHHCFLRKIPNQKTMDYLYSNYYNYPSALEGSFEPTRDNRFLSFFKKNVFSKLKEINSKKILEIGCYDGYILYNIKKSGLNVTGCDPSKGAEIGKKFGLNIIKQFFKPDYFTNKKLFFDIIISRHFLEHTIKPKEILSNISKVMKPNGYLILEIPNIEFYLNKGLLEVFSLQHLHGFSSLSISNLLNNSGMKVVKIEKTPENLIVLCQKGKNKKKIYSKNWRIILKKFINRFKRNKKKISQILNKYTKQKKTIAFWGGGGFSVAALNLYGVEKKDISYIIDSDAKKWGMQYLDHSIPIISPYNAKRLYLDLIVITSYYSKDIYKQIKKMQFKCKVLNIFPDIKIIN